MLHNKISPWVLAASVVVATAGSAMAITSVEELTDVNPNSWAYEALTDLVEKYDVIEGYPDLKFRGNKFATRYEMAAALDALLKSVGRDLARLGAEKANKADLEALAKLQDEFAAELATLRGRVDALESRATAIEEKNAEQDERLDLLEKTQLHGDFSFGFLADFNDGGPRAAGATPGQNDGFSDSLSTFGRLRLGVNVPVYEGSEDGKIGDGNVVARLTAAYGRTGPMQFETGRTGSENLAPFSGINMIAAGGSYFNENAEGDDQNGSVQQDSGELTSFNLRQNVYVDLAYYKQHFKTGIPILTDLFPGADILPNDGLHETTADMYLGVMDWRNLFNRSPYRGDELTQFINTSLVNNAALLPNFVAPGVAFAWKQGLGEHYSLDLTAGASMPNSQDGLNPLILTEEAALHYDTHWLGEKYNKPGTLYAGAYQVLSMGNGALADVPNQGGGYLTRGDNNYPVSGRQSINGFYVGWNQELYRGAGVSVDYAYNEGGGNNALLVGLRQGTGANLNLNNADTIAGIRQSLTAALSIPLSVFDADLTKRGKDTIGIGYAWIDPLDLNEALANNSDEHILEAYYRLQLTDSISIVPSVQAVFNGFANGDNNGYWVGSVRANYVF